LARIGSAKSATQFHDAAAFSRVGFVYDRTDQTTCGWTGCSLTGCRSWRSILVVTATARRKQDGGASPSGTAGKHPPTAQPFCFD